MGETMHFNTAAELFENEFGELAIRFPDNRVYARVGTTPGAGFLTEASTMLRDGRHPDDWERVPFGRLGHDGHGWRLVGTLGFLDGDEGKPAVGLDVRPEELGSAARSYLLADLPGVMDNP